MALEPEAFSQTVGIGKAGRPTVAENGRRESMDKESSPVTRMSNVVVSEARRTEGQTSKYSDRDGQREISL